jgi:hypothetical protein
MRWVFAVFASWSSVGVACISSRCLRDADCPGSAVCRELTGACAEPECSETDRCDRGFVCEDRFCVQGCETTDDCVAGEECVSRRCLTVGVECDCPMAHPFCAVDINPNSPTAGSELCLPDDFPDGVGLFFGSIYCGHCTDDFDALRTRRAELTADGLDARMVWVQFATATATPQDVGTRLAPDVTDPVLHDTVALRVWEAYGTTWYRFVIVDAHGCWISDHGPLNRTLLEGPEGDAIVSKWREAMDEACPPVAP